jgi:hypothetical protein
MRDTGMNPVLLHYPPKGVKMSGDVKEAVMAVITKNAEKGKKKTYITDVPKLVPEFPKSEVRKAVQDLIAEQKLAYWSSGSTTYVMLQADFEQYKHTMEDAPAE